MTTKNYTIADRPTYTYKRVFSGAMIDWLKKGLIRDGFLPQDLSVAVGSDKLQQIWLGLKNKHVNDIQHEVRLMWYQAVANEQNIEVDRAMEKVEALIASWDICIYLEEVTPEQVAEVKEVAQKSGLTTAPALDKTEVLAAQKIRRLIANNETAKHVLWYILQEYPIYRVGFCKTAGIHTATMKATANHITNLAKCPKDVMLADYLRRILMVGTTEASSKTREDLG